LAQVPRIETRNGHVFATVTFTRSSWNGSPPYYSIAVDSEGDAAYESSPRSEEKTGVPYTVEFHATAAVHDRIFHLVEQLKFLKLSANEVQSSLPADEAIQHDEPVDTLEFCEGSADNQITYHAAKNPLIQQVTGEFERLSTTLEFGHQLARLHQSHNPDLAKELTRLQERSRQGRIEDLPVIVPVLQEIASDKKEDKAVRQEAEALLRSAKP
jgi:hypothetical protein